MNKDSPNKEIMVGFCLDPYDFVIFEVDKQPWFVVYASNPSTQEA
jgi:hypothetical protein